MLFMGASGLRMTDWERVAREAQYKPARMASLCSVSERHLQRIFHKYLHCTPSKWLRELQCRVARELISKGYSSKAAAAEVNFSTEAHFCREFKRIFGASPQKFAPNHQFWSTIWGGRRSRNGQSRKAGLNAGTTTALAAR